MEPLSGRCIIRHLVRGHPPQDVTTLSALVSKLAHLTHTVTEMGKVLEGMSKKRPVVPREHSR